MYPDPVVF